jgi:hypothetical protein
MSDSDDFAAASERLAAMWPAAKQAEQALRELGAAFGRLPQDLEGLRRLADQEGV